MILKLSYALLLLFFAMNSIFSQHHFQCATDEMHQQLFNQRPDLHSGIIKANEALNVFTKNFQLSENSRNGDPYIIPVVFHVIHNFGPENISDAQILDGLHQTNIQLRKLNADTTDIVTEFKGIAADVEIELRLARKDPDGNCTNGITRTVSPLTNIGDHQVKSLIQWPPDKYLNIYVCNQAAGLAGHAMLPGAADTIPAWDGIVMQHSYVGTIGTSDFFRRTVLTHEVGHYLNLQHIWGGNNVPNYFYLPVAQASNCDHDDDVADTPNTIGWQSCNLTGNSCGSLDNVQNYMDYAYCARMFTEGQKHRMHACLNSPIAGRNNLWTTTNLAETGVDGNFEPLCEAFFSADETVVCAGESVTFSDLSFHSVTNRAWTFVGGNITQSADSLVVVTFNQPGTFDVTLKVSNGIDTLTLFRENYVTVLPANGAWTGISETCESIEGFSSKFIIEQTESPYAWQIGTPGYQSDGSIQHLGYDAPSGTYSFYSKPIDASQLNTLVVKFDAAFVGDQSSANDILRIQVSNDCGQTWTTRRNFSPVSLNSVEEEITGYFVPTNQQWKKHEVTNFSAQFLSEQTMVRFQFTSSGQGNNFYIDNIQIGDPDALNVNELPLNNSAISIYPNPNAGTLYFKGLKNEATYTVVIQDVLGKTHLSATLLGESLSIEQFTSGIYFCKLYQDGNLAMTKRLIKR
ncbi:MAG: T9SS type A sorting domain-containing protein [Crocinitomicaceae bacterium]|nr:T9SS type A sorting domain-containing protein [Crocinitomicaceae bacterium]